jgi:DNA-binding MarR family transcriptional regulator
MSTSRLTSNIIAVYYAIMSENKDEESPVKFMEGIDEENVTQEIWKSLNKLYSYVSHLVNYKYHLILYRLVKKGIKIEDIASASGYSRQRLHKIVTEFEKREIERIHENS